MSEKTLAGTDAELLHASDLDAASHRGVYFDEPEFMTEPTLIRLFRTAASDHKRVVVDYVVPRTHTRPEFPCEVCGTPTTKCCARCRMAWYCSKSCQTPAWRAGGHRAECAVLVARYSGVFQRESIGAVLSVLFEPEIIHSMSVFGTAARQQDLVLRQKPHSATRVVRRMQTRSDFDVNMYIDGVHLICACTRIPDDLRREFVDVVAAIPGLDLMSPDVLDSTCTVLERITRCPAGASVLRLVEPRHLTAVCAETYADLPNMVYFGGYCACSPLTQLIQDWCDGYGFAPYARDLDAITAAFGVDSNGMDIDRICWHCERSISRVRGHGGPVEQTLAALRATSAAYHRELPAILRTLFPWLAEPMGIVFGYLDQTKLAPVTLIPTSPARESGAARVPF